MEQLPIVRRASGFPIRLRRVIQRPHSLSAEMGFAALVLLVWHLVRIPVEGSVAVSVSHAHQIMDLESRLSINAEPPLIRLGRDPELDRLLQWVYTNLHIPVLFAFLAAARLRAPHRYPRLRTIFALSFIPAFVVIWLFPTAPPRWLPELGMGPTPQQNELSDTLGALLQNSTAAAASQHFGIAVFVAAGSMWAFPRTRLASLALLYPALIFTVIVATGNHYVVDCLIGTATFLLAASAAVTIHHRSPFTQPPPFRIRNS